MATRPHPKFDRPRRNPDNAFREVGEKGGLVVVPAKSTVEVLNPVGSKIFSMLDGSHTRSEIVDAVAEEFEVPREQAAEDLDRFLEELEQSRLLADAGTGSDPKEATEEGGG